MFKKKNPLNQALIQEFNIYWNQEFARNILNKDIALEFPCEVEKYFSIWLLEWNKYFDEKYEQFKTPLRKMSFNDIMIEKNKLNSFFNNIESLNVKHIEGIAYKLLESLPYNKNNKNRYKIAFKNMIFHLALLEASQLINEETTESLNVIIKSYYSSFDYSKLDKDSKYGNIFTTSFYGKNTNLKNIVSEKIDFFSPKNKDEAQILVYLAKDKQEFSNAFNEVAGMSSQNFSMQELYYNMIVTQSYYNLSEKIVIKNTITNKKIKI